MWTRLKSKTLPTRRDPGITPLPNVLYKSYILRKEEKYDEAIAFLANYLAQEHSLDDTHIQTRFLYHELLKQQKMREDMLSHGKELIAMLVTAGMAKRAFPVYRDCIKTDRSFRLDYAKETFHLCKAAFKANDHRLFLAASNGFFNLYSDYENIVELYLMMARVLILEYRKDEDASRILRFLLKKYPQDELIPDVEKELALISRLESSLAN